jgi:hypothetical protein
MQIKKLIFIVLFIVTPAVIFQNLLLVIDFRFTNSCSIKKML